MSELKTEQLSINMGPQHPSTHGVLRLVLTLDGEIVTEVKPVLGYLHRCFEKHCESMTYPQVIPYTDRMDYLNSMNNELAYVLAAEKLLGIQVPERVEYIRVIMSELQRIASHLVAIGTYGNDAGAFTPFLYCFMDREKILELFDIVCGARLLYNYIWVGGLSHDITPEFVTKTKEFMKYFRPRIKQLNNLLSYNKIFIERTAGIGILPQDVAINAGVSGPTLRGSGVKYDLRKDDKYSIYDRFDFDVCVGTGERGVVGDSWNRYIVRAYEMEQSLRIIEQAIDNIPEGDVQSAVPKRVKPVVGESYVRTESPKGELAYYIISDGSLNPYRIKARSPSFCNLSVINQISRGHMIADVVMILGSFDIVLGCIDR
ncbi:MAG TPA: NADH-quinone oxidoreductase subunit D [Ignavibacteria bacterium]|nr:NADH-quinone oxidoreductase subunit D [Ignavibacteria bacterium]